MKKTILTVKDVFKVLVYYIKIRYFYIIYYGRQRKLGYGYMGYY